MLKKTLRITLLLGLFSINTHAQVPVFEWARSMGGASNESGLSTTVDASGNVYTTGFFTGTVDFDPGAGDVSITTLGSSEAFIQKLDASGNFVWAKAIQGGFSVNSNSIATDAVGNVYITGTFRNTPDFDPGAGTFNMTAAVSSDIFILKLDTNGNFVWAKSIGGTSGELSYSIATDAAGNVYTTGYFGGVADFDPGAGTVNLTAVGFVDVFISKLDTNGNFVWAKSVGGTTSEFGLSTTVDASGNVFVTGHFTGTVDFDPSAGTTNITSIGMRDIFILKLNASGNFVWARAVGGTDNDEGNSLTTDALGNVYVVGFFDGEADFDPGPSTTTLTSFFFSVDAFVLKLNSSGNFVWAKSMGGFSRNEAECITIDASGNIYTVGTFAVNADFDPGAGTNVLTSAGGRDTFVQKLDTDGNFIWARSIGGASNDDGFSIFIDDSNNIHVTGFFEATADFDPSAGITNLTSVGLNDIFVVKISQCTPTNLDPDIANLPDLANECSVAMPSTPTATNNCGDVIIGTPNVSFPITTSGTTVVTWTYDDGNGNTATQTQNAIINDVTAPVADVASLTDLTSQCSVAMPTAPTATDNCTGSIAGTPNVGFPITTQGTTVITWTYDDGNGNTATQTQNVIINDVTAPVADVASLTDLTSQCSVAMPTAPTATDNCTGSIAGIPNVGFPITTQGTTVITWTYDDGNGNISTQTQNAIINDVTAPVADVASLTDLTSQCSVAMPTAPTATDNCTGIINGTTNTTFPITTSGTTVITWTYDDGNGNISTQTQNAIINDVTAPIADVTSLADLTGQCSVAMPTVPTATDNCTGIINGTTNIAFPITTSGTTVITWTYDDGNGNISTQTQNASINDVTAPVADIASLPDLTSQCSVAMPTAPTATDNCTGSIAGTPNVSFPITTQATTVITWTYDDGNGNSSTQTQNVIINDVTAPVADVTSLADLSSECSVAMPTAPTATDNCAGSIAGTPNVNFPITMTTVVTWTYDDGNGNTSTQTQNVIINDGTAPVANVASLADLSGECSVAMPTAPTATDNCAGSIAGNPNVSFPITMTTVVTWTYDDGNGNTSTQTQNVIINDGTAPVANVASLADLSGECSVAMPTAPTASDNCASSIAGTPNVGFPITMTTVVTWTYIDGNGNTATQTQNVIISDGTAPVADVASLADLSGECSVTIPTAPTASDNCASSIAGTPNVGFPITTQGTTVITWTYIDGNGNTSTQTQNVIINDVTAPVADVASLADLTGQCSVEMPTAPTATDNCTGIISGTTNTTFPITTSGTTVVTWTYDDGNGNISTQTLNVIINDVTPPVADVTSLADITSQCSVAMPTAPTATDNCAGIISGTTNTTFPITTSGTTVITWTYDDGNGNTATQIQNVVITPIDNSISVSDAILSANANGYTYQWIDCADNNVSIVGATNQNFTAQSSGSYAVIISNETCSVTSDCIDFTITSISKDLNKVGISVYPNPFVNSLIIDKGENKELEIEIIYSTGKLVLSETITKQESSIDMSKYVSGIYFVTLKNKQDKITYRIMKN